MSFDFIHLSDVHISASQETLLSLGLRTKEWLDRWSMDSWKKNFITAVKMINSSKASFTILSGDLTETGCEEDFQAYLEMQKMFNMPVYPVPGNHDVGNIGNWQGLQGSFKNYEKFVGSPYYSFNYHNCHFIGLCSSLITGSIADIDNLDKRREEQNNWFLNDLVSASGAGYFHIFVFMEYPPQGGYTLRYTRDLYDLLPIFARYSVDAVFSGHMHDNIEDYYKGVHLITTTSTTDYYKNSEGPGFRLVHVKENTFSSEFIPIRKKVNRENL